MGFGGLQDFELPHEREIRMRAYADGFKAGKQEAIDEMKRAIATIKEEAEAFGKEHSLMIEYAE